MNIKSTLKLLLTLLFLFSPTLAQETPTKIYTLDHINIIYDSTVTEDEADSLARAYGKLLELSGQVAEGEAMGLAHDEGTYYITMGCTPGQLVDEDLLETLTVGLNYIANLAFPEQNVQTVLFNTDDTSDIRVIPLGQEVSLKP